MTHFLDVDGLAQRWNTTAKVVYGLRYRHQAPPAIRIGRELRFALQDVEKWEAARRDNGGSNHAA